MNSSNKVVFLGDGAIGKSTLINTLCGVQNSRPQSTLGCSISIFAHQYAAGTPDECEELIELWDIGGSSAHRNASQVFFDNASGVVFVYDKSNSRSKEHLSIWKKLFFNHRSLHSNRSFNRLNSKMSSSGGIENSDEIPVLIVGTHLDESHDRQKNQAHFAKSMNISNQYDHHVCIDARKPILPLCIDVHKPNLPGLLFSGFFDSVIEKSQSFERRSFTQSRRQSLV